MNFNELLNSAEYDFIRTNERLGDRIMLLGLGGSYAYGTNNESSDIDIRGITLEIKKRATEKEENPQMPVIREFIKSEIVNQEFIANSLEDDHNNDWSMLDRIFIEVIKEDGTF